jgi:thiol:disulfide interchange protein
MKQFGKWAAAALLVLAVGCGSQKGATPVASTPASTKPAVQWVKTYEEAVTQAKQQNKPMLIDVMASWCSSCKKLDRDMWTREDVGTLSRSFVAVKVDGDERPDVKKKYAVSGYPTTLLLSPQNKELDRVRGVPPVSDMLDAMRGALGTGKSK